MASVDPEKLLAELQDKEHMLVKAAGYGKDLLEENDKLKNDLKRLQIEYARLEEVCSLADQVVIASSIFPPIHAGNRIKAT